MSLVVYGSMLGKTSERFVVKKEGKVIDEMPFFRVSEIVVPSRGVTVSAGAIFEAVARGIRISFLVPTGTPYALLSSSALVATVETRGQQLAALADRRGLEFARAAAAIDAASVSDVRSQLLGAEGGDRACVLARRWHLA
jgi:CRISPR-associated protein Cas1